MEIHVKNLFDPIFFSGFRLRFTFHIAGQVP